MDNFSFNMPTRIVFGRDTETEVGRLVARYGGTRVLVLFGGGSVVRSGLLKRVFASLDRALLDHVELGGVQPNPRASMVYEGISLVKDEKVDFILAVGGGSSSARASAPTCAPPRSTCSRARFPRPTSRPSSTTW